MKPFLKLKLVNEVIAMIFCAPVLDSEQAPLAQAAGRRLAKDFTAPEDLPGFPRATMDGYAVRAKDVFGATETSPGLLTVTGQVKMGEASWQPLEPGGAIAISTGAMLPAGADSVLMVEYARPVAKGLIEATKSVAPGENIVQGDEDARQGEVVIEAGRLLRAQEIGLMAAFGMESVEVAKKPKVRVFSSGDEVVPLHARPAPGQIRDINAWTLMTLCGQAQAAPEFGGILKDDRAALDSALGSAIEEFDVIVISGGSSAGMRDLTLAALQSLPGAEILAHGVAVSPGKPFILARAGSAYLLGLPGHAAGALVCARVFLLPLLARLQGLQAPAPDPYIMASLARSVASAQGRRDYIRCSLAKKNGQWQASPILASSSLISSLVKADGYVICPEDSEGLYINELVPFYPF